MHPTLRLQMNEAPWNTWNTYFQEAVFCYASRGLPFLLHYGVRAQTFVENAWFCFRHSVEVTHTHSMQTGRQNEPSGSSCNAVKLKSIIISYSLDCFLEDPFILTAGSCTLFNYQDWQVLLRNVFAIVSVCASFGYGWACVARWNRCEAQTRLQFRYAGGLLWWVLRTISRRPREVCISGMWRLNLGDQYIPGQRTPHRVSPFVWIVHS